MRIRGRYAEAEPLYLETVETQKRVLGDDHPDTLISINNLATLYENQGRWAEAERCRRMWPFETITSPPVLVPEPRGALQWLSRVAHAAGVGPWW